MRHLRSSTRIAAIALAVLALGTAADAEDLRIAVESSTATMDPHEYNNSPNLQVYLNVFETLVGVSPTGEKIPRLATEWRPLSDTEWEIVLREGVKFHDGTDFTAEDVAFSIERARHGQGPSTFASRVAPITEVKVIDDHTVHLVTEDPYPLLDLDLQFVFMVSSEAAEGATPADFDSGEAAVGTGAYKFVSYTPGEQVTLKAFPDYWGGTPAWDTVTYRVIPDASAREVALLSGDVDLIETPSTINIARLEQDPNVRVWSIPSDRATFIGFSLRDAAPDVEGTEGENPFADPKVRAAVSHAIDRQLLIDRVLSGAAVPASQMLPAGNFGHNPEIAVDAYDPERARQLLAEAGYPEGFSPQMWVAEERVSEARRVGPAVAAMLSQVGIGAGVEVLPYAVWRPAAREGDYSLFMNSYRSSIPDASGALRAIFSDSAQGDGFGSQNYSGVVDQAATDALISTNRELDEGVRERMLQDEIARLMDERRVVPLFWEINYWVSAPGVVYEPRTDTRTAAIFATPAE